MASTIDGHFVWYENLTKDPSAAIAFYGEVFGWKTQPFGEGANYTMWVASQGPIGGVMKLPAEAEQMGAPPHWLGNVQVKNVDATVAQAKELGAKVYNGPFDVPNVGRVAILADPQGAVLSVFQPASSMEAHEAKEGEVCWRELITSDSDAAWSFYSKVFGWKVQEEMDMGPMGKYRIYGVGEARLGGFMSAPPGAQMPPAWLFYVDTSDVEAAMGRATRLGAKVLNGPMDIPGGGKIVQMMDPQGAAFAIHQGPKG